MTNYRTQFANLMSSLGAVLTEGLSLHNNYELYIYKGVPIVITVDGYVKIYREHFACLHEHFTEALYTFKYSEIDPDNLITIINNTANCINI